MKIVLFGGTFDPPHNWHLMLARQLFDILQPNELWFVPTFEQIYFRGKVTKETFFKPEDRYNMTRLLEFPGVVTKRFELDNKLDGQTIHLLPYLPPDNEYYFPIGADHVKSLNEWQGIDILLKKLHFVVLPRYGVDVEGLLLPGVELLQSDLFVQSDLSSSYLRKRLELGLSIKEFVPPPVYGYLLDNRLIREGIPWGKETLG